MADYCKSVKCGLRPHVKAHKNPLIAKKQRDAGAVVGFCAQTLEEAEAMVMNGVDHVLLTNMLSSQNAINRFLNLRANGEIMITLDNLENAKLLAKAAVSRGLTVDTLVEVNVGQNRTGVAPGEEAARLAAAISEIAALHFKGLMGYEGHVQLAFPEYAQRKEKTMAALDGLSKSIDAIKKRSLELEIVSSGGTGTYNITAEYPGVSEIQPGSYVVMDTRYSLMETCGKDFGNALSILSTVVSTPTEEQAVVDMGWKACSIEYQLFGWDGMPKAMNSEGAYSPGGDEHGILKFKEKTKRPKTGDRIRFLPSHCDTTVNLHSKFYGIRGDRVELMLPIARR